MNRVALALAVIGALAIATATARAGTIDATALRDGTVIVKGTAKPKECENAEAQFQWDFQVPQYGPRPPCGGHFALLARAPAVRITRRSIRPLADPCGKLPTIPEFWNHQTPFAWFHDLADGLRWERRNPPLRLAWLSEPVVAGDTPQQISARLHLDYGLWAGGMLETPCLYLVYLLRAEGAESAPSCLPEFNKQVREEVCSQHYWSEIWVQRLGKAYAPTPYQQCAQSQERLGLAERALDRFWRHHRHARRLPPPLLAQENQSLHRVEVTCPRESRY